MVLGDPPIVHAAANAVGAADEFGLMLHDDAVEKDGDAGFLDQFVGGVPSRGFPDDVISLPFAGRLGGVDQRWHLPVKSARLAVGVRLVMVGIHDLDFVHIVDKNPAVAAGLAMDIAGRIRLRKLDVQLEVGPLPPGADVAGSRDFRVTVLHFPTRSPSAAVLPFREVLAVKERLGIGRRRSALAECGAGGDDRRLRAVGVVLVPFAAGDEVFFVALNVLGGRSVGLGGRGVGSHGQGGQKRESAGLNAHVIMNKDVGFHGAQFDRFEASTPAENVHWERNRRADGIADDKCR